MDREAAKHDEATNHRSALESMGNGGWRRDRASVIEVRASRSVTWPANLGRSRNSSIPFRNNAPSLLDRDMRLSCRHII